jgi:four helix bundle protein
MSLKDERSAARNSGTRDGSEPNMLNLRHHSLVAWQRADDLFIRVHQLTLSAFPPIERYELSSQLRRAAYSVPANIVEGYGRRRRRERLRYLNIAEASLAEVSYRLHAAGRLGYLSPALSKDLEKDLNGVGAPLAGLIRSVRASREDDEA